LPARMRELLLLCFAVFCFHFGHLIHYRYINSCPAKDSRSGRTLLIEVQPEKMRSRKNGAKYRQKASIVDR
jgi:hypothetical protein